MANYNTFTDYEKQRKLQEIEEEYSGLVCQNNFGGIKKLILPG